MVLTSDARAGRSSAWAAPLLALHPAGVARALDDAARALGVRPAGPRAGVGAALAYGAAGAWDRRVDKRALRLGAAALEVANAAVFADEPLSLGRLAGRVDPLRPRAAIAWLLSAHGAGVERLLDRWLATGGRAPVSEGALAARASFAVGALAADLPAPAIDALDALGSAIGDAWEVGDPTDALAGLSALPPGAFADALAASLRRMGGPAPARRFPGWIPRAAPPSIRIRRDRIDDAMDALVAGGPPVVVAAARWLGAQGGKRVRPALALAACEAVGGDPRDALVGAAGVEWVHLASLALDDWMDDAPLRRGQPALHAATDAPFACGVAAWILAHVHASVPRPAGPVLDRAMRELAEGQLAELAHERDLALPVSERLAVLASKTGALFAAAAEIGALAGDPAARARLRAFGRELGVAFQIVDDVLDVRGEVGSLGKAPGADLRAGKVTLPLALYASAHPAERPAILRALGGPDADVWRDRLAASGACDQALAIARRRRERAFAALAPAERTPALLGLADRLVERAC